MKNTDYELSPVRKLHTTTVCGGFETSSAHVVGGKIADLPVTRCDDTMNSIWRMRSVWERIKFLFHGEITLRVLMHRQPPVVLVAGDVFRG